MQITKEQAIDIALRFAPQRRTIERVKAVFYALTDNGNLVDSEKQSVFVGQVKGTIPPVELTANLNIQILPTCVNRYNTSMSASVSIPLFNTTNDFMTYEIDVCTNNIHLSDIGAGLKHYVSFIGWEIIFA